MSNPFLNSSSIVQKYFFLSEENSEANTPTEPFKSLLFSLSIFSPQLPAKKKSTLHSSKHRKHTRIAKHTYSFLGDLNPFQLFLIHF